MGYKKQFEENFFKKDFFIIIISVLGEKTFSTSHYKPFCIVKILSADTRGQISKGSASVVSVLIWGEKSGK